MGAYILTLLKQDSLFVAEDSTKLKEGQLQRQQEIQQLEKEQKKQQKKLQLEEDLLTLHDYLKDNEDFKETIVEELITQPLAKYKKSESFEWNVTQNTFFQTYLVSWLRRTYPQVLK
jgi:hypothetical protein